MARLDLNQANKWIAEEHDGVVVHEVQAKSAIEQVARKVVMGTDTKSVPRLIGDSPDVLAEGAAYTEAAATMDNVILTAKKFGKIYSISEEDVQDSFVDVLNEYKLDFARGFANKFDNACLGVTVAADGTNVAPFTSVYSAVTAAADVATRKTTVTKAALKLNHFSDALAVVETSSYFDPSDMVVIASPALKGYLRTLVDGLNNLVLERGDALDVQLDQLFGYPVIWSYGARTSAASSAKPTGNNLVIFGTRKLLLNGVRSGPESIVSRDADFRTDGVLLKTRARRGFAVAKTEGFSIVEVTP